MCILISVSNISFQCINFTYSKIWRKKIKFWVSISIFFFFLKSGTLLKIHRWIAEFFLNRTNLFQIFEKVKFYTSKNQLETLITIPVSKIRNSNLDSPKLASNFKNFAHGRGSDFRSPCKLRFKHIFEKECLTNDTGKKIYDTFSNTFLNPMFRPHFG